MKQLFRKIAIVLCLIMVAPTILGYIPLVNSVSVAEAAAKATIGNEKATIAIASTESIYIYDRNKKATYTYKSSNTKVATVDKKGTIKGVSAGTAKITVSQTLNKKTTKVGTHTVVVKAAHLYETKTVIGIGSSYYPYMEYVNCAATYTITSSDKSILSVSEDGYCVGLKAGKAKLTIKEKYKKKTTKIGTVEVTVASASINESTQNITIEVGSQTDPTQLIYIDNQNYNYDANGNGAVYTYTSADPSIANIQEVYDDFWEEYSTGLVGVAAGTTTITVTETYAGVSTIVGTVTVTVQ
ncbi:MAG: Ig-like domain-containing protein [Herbinix sp.]|nr:Ig-like domain-containing protein [Herbinix sp.]